jgi:CheY-like chemotaxis protein/two-component sensor histidine kinase
MNPKPVDLNQIIKTIEKFMHRIIGEDIDFKMIFHQDLLTVHADQGQIEQVLMNLAVNARDAMPRGGELSIETRPVTIDADFIKAHGYGEPGEYAVVSMSDNGMGMDEITRKRLFEPFYTTKELGKGTGLGLSIVYGIVKQHNGYIEVDSEPGAGTVFTIHLPLIKEEIREIAGHVDELPEIGTETLLVADDDATLLDLTKKVLEQFGYTVITAIDGLDAVEKFRDNSDNIALVILDVIMPRMNGKEAFDEIRKIRPAMKAIFISGYTAEIIHVRGTLDESLEFLTKPLRMIKFLQKVREVLDGTKLHAGSEEQS